MYLHGQGNGALLAFLHCLRGKLPGLARLTVFEVKERKDTLGTLDFFCLLIIQLGAIE